MGEQNINVLVIDSESESLKNITELLRENDLVSDIDSAENSDLALLKVVDSNPDIVFLEFPTKGNAGKSLIKFIRKKLPETNLIFVSRTKEYATTAIKNEVFNYLLKPVNREVLDKVIDKVQLIKLTNFQARINQIIEQTPADSRLKFQTIKGYLIVNPEEILYGRADGFYTELHLTKDRIELTNIFISKLEEILSPYGFLRISRSFIVNQKYIRKIFRGNNSVILSSEGKEHEVKGSKLYIKNLSNLNID